MSEVYIALGVITGVLGLIYTKNAWDFYRRYQSVTVFTGGEQPSTTDEATVEGTVEVQTPAVPDRQPPEEVSGNRPALWLWRVQQEIKQNRSSHWKTLDAGVAAGTFTIQDDWDQVEIDTTSVCEKMSSKLTEPIAIHHEGSSGQISPTETGSFDVSDPFNSTQFHVGNPEITILLGEKPLGQRLVDKYLPGDFNVTTSVDGPLRTVLAALNPKYRGGTTTPHRYQATIIRDGDELSVHGRLNEDSDSAKLVETEDIPLVFSSGNIENKEASYRSKAIKKGIIGAVLLVISVPALLTGTVV